MLNQTAYIDMIDRAIESIPYPDEPRGLYDPIAYTLESGGKRLRPVLLLATADACGMEPEGCINQALGIEMFHNFTLLHDDVMDRSDVRRGRPTVHRRWNECTAILSGDAMLTMATRLVAKCRMELLPEVLSLFNTTAMEIYEGQQYDMDFESRKDVTVADYIKMIRLKTSVLLGCACRMGALVAGASEERQAAMYGFGEALGLAFQLQDDWLDTYGDPITFGKSIGGDILNDKKTFLRITAMNRADESQRRLIESFDGKRDYEDKVPSIKAVYDATGAATECRTLIDHYGDMAIAALKKAGLDRDAEEFFAALALKSLHRIN